MNNFNFNSNSNSNSNSKIIFILPNIYESINGVSTKYVKFINYLKDNSYNYVIFATFKNENLYKRKVEEENLKIIKTSGLNVPFYKEIKIPFISESLLNDEIKDGNEIIVFNGEFIWLFNILKNIKKKYNNIRLYPTMHTNYIYYNENIYKNYTITSVLNYLDNYLEKKIFNGIIVTGEQMKNKYSQFTDSIFNANEINLDIFSTCKKDNYDSKFYNIIYCGRVSKEKHIDEILDCLLKLKKVTFHLHIIGDGPYLDNLKTVIDLGYREIKENIIFHGSKSQEDINNLYQTLDNRIFIFTSESETFGKTPMEAGMTGMPIFIKKNDVSESLYVDKKNAFLFSNPNQFVDSFEYWIQLDKFDKELFISNSISNIKKYDQKVIFDDWIYFLINGKIKNKFNIHFFDMITFHTLSRFVNCTGSILSD